STEILFGRQQIADRIPALFDPLRQDVADLVIARQVAMRSDRLVHDDVPLPCWISSHALASASRKAGAAMAIRRSARSATLAPRSSAMPCSVTTQSTSDRETPAGTPAGSAARMRLRVPRSAVD